MLTRSPARSLKLCCGCLLLSVWGCGRSTVVVTPDGAEGVTAHAARGKGADDTDGPAFRFPADRGGTLLAKVLPPGESEAARPDRVTRPRKFSPPAAVKKSPSLPLPPSQPLMPRLPEDSKPVVAGPRFMIEETLEGSHDGPALPEVQSLPAGERARLPSADVNEPPALPILAQPVPDRAPLDDATAEASTAAALAAPPPQRLNMAPFLRLTLPDPYDHRRPVVLPALAEGVEPAAATPRLPESSVARAAVPR